jgi:hypothetical protein
VELAKERRSAIAAHRMRSAGELRPDVLMYLTVALERFAGMSLDQIQELRSLRPIEQSTPYSVLSFCSHQLRLIKAGSIS